MRQGMEYRARVAADGGARGGEMRQGMEYRARVAADGGARGGEMRQGMEYRARVAQHSRRRCPWRRPDFYCFTTISRRTIN